MQTETVEAFVGQVISDLSATYAAVLISLGDRLGLYRALAGAGPIDPDTLAERTGLYPRYVREWLRNQAAGGYVTYDSATGCYELPPEHAWVLANPESPVLMTPAFGAAAAFWHAEDKLAAAFRSGDGIAWGDHHHRLFHATEAFFRNGYKANLVSQWIPALDGVEERLAQGATVADIGCGHGASTIILARAFPRSTFWGFDAHAPSVATARERAEEAGVSDRTHFEEATADSIAGRGYDLVCFFDAFHDFGDPLSAAQRCREVIAEDGVLMLVEPFAHDDDALNKGPVARLFTGASTGFCTPNAVAQGGRYTLGAAAGPKRLAEVLADAGFTRVRRAFETPFNIILEARP